MQTKFQHLSMSRKFIVALGYCLISAGFLGLVMAVVRIFPPAYASAFQSLDVRTTAGVAIAGCLLAAIGYWEQ